MKKTKLIIPAIGMLLLSTAASITGTVAWFSMNTTVSATGMTIKAKGDQVFLQIVNGTGTFVNGQNQITAEAINDVTSLAAANVVGGLGTDEDDKQTIDDYDRTSVVWVTNHSVNPGSATPSGDYIAISEGSLPSYALINTFKIRLDPLAGEDVNAPDPLKVTSVAFGDGTPSDEPMRNAVSVLVESTEGTGETAVTHYQLFKQDNSGLAANVVYDGGFAEIAGPGKLTTGVFSDHSVNGTTVKVYVFFDGDNQSAYTSNITTSGYTVELTFSVDY